MLLTFTLPKGPPSATAISLRVSAPCDIGGSIQQDVIAAFELGK